MEPLCHPISPTEVLHALGTLPIGKAPGPDLAEFFKDNWASVGLTVMAMLRNFRSGHPQFRGHICFIPKTEAPSSIPNIRPIYLTNVCSRLPGTCGEAGAHSSRAHWEAAFLLGRTAMDNILLAQEVPHLISSRRGLKSMVLLKIDLAKAFNYVNWDSLLTISAHMGFPSCWNTWLGGTPFHLIGS